MPESEPGVQQVNHILNAQPGVLNLTCYGFHVWAEDFLTAEQLYAPKARQGSFVGHFLCCQSIELALKAYLSLKGVGRNRLKKQFGHNLICLLNGARHRGLEAHVPVTVADVKLMTLSTTWYDVYHGKRL